MSRSSQKNYLDRLLKPGEAAGQEEQENAGRAPSVLGSPLLTRANSLERIASGELKQVAHVRLDPKRCRIWSGNARDYAALTYERCKDLIDSMIAEGGQKVPALVRKLKNDPAHDYEVIYGTRRHWATSWLRANNYSDFVFLAEVRDLDDEAAFRLADLENRARQDITEIERAKNYAAALPLHYAGKQAKMAERLNISKGLLSKMIAFANINDKIIAAFAAPGELSLRQGYALAQAVSSPSAASRATRAAGAIVKENAALAEAGKAALATAAVLSRLLAAASGETEVPPDVRQVLYQGKPLVTVLDENRKGVRFQVHAGTGADLEVIVASVREALQASALGGDKND
ncbi:MAG TPA: ParB/RepB/Spo0J family partition protein [Edaphobacter sp.]|nr:ParB/RepB/Spo0J family partition protein [Edaphobacter sp.]